MFYKKPCKVFLALFESAEKIICGVTIQITATKKYFTVFVGIIIPSNCFFFSCSSSTFFFAYYCLAYSVNSSHECRLFCLRLFSTKLGPSFYFSVFIKSIKHWYRIYLKSLLWTILLQEKIWFYISHVQPSPLPLLSGTADHLGAIFTRQRERILCPERLRHKKSK